MKFKEWLQLQEVGTGTNAIAVFSRPIFGGEMFRRTPIEMFGSVGNDDKGKKKKHK